MSEDLGNGKNTNSDMALNPNTTLYGLKLGSLTLAKGKGMTELRFPVVIEIFQLY